MGVISNAARHLTTITKHRHAVMLNCFKAGIPLQGLVHDLSKFSPIEFFAGVRYYQGWRSPNEGEREAIGYSGAWMHHKGRNRHHFEYWTDYNPQTKLVQPVRMPLRFVIEMFCDRVAASMIYRGKDYKESHPLDYFMNAKARRIIHPETSDQLEDLLRMLSEKGEAETYAYIRSLLRAERKAVRGRR